MTEPDTTGPVRPLPDPHGPEKPPKANDEAISEALAALAENARLRSQLAEAREQRDQAAEALVQAETERDEARDRLRTLIDEVERHAGAQCACDTNGECLARLYQQAHALVARAPETAPESPHTAEPAPEQAEASTEHIGDADGAVAYWRAEISEILAAWLGEEQRTGWQRLASDVAEQILRDLDIADMAAERDRLRTEAAMLRAEREWLADRARRMGIAEAIIAAHGPAHAVSAEAGRLRAEVKRLRARVREWEAVNSDLAERCDSGDIPIRIGERYSLAVLREIDRLRDQWRTLATLVEPLGILDADSNDPATLTDRICRWISDLREDSAYQARVLGERQQEIDRLRDVLTQREERLASWDEAAETVATFDRDGTTYEIDHLGIGHPRQWGEYAVYRDGEQVAEFAVPGAGLREEYRPSLPQTDELIELASAALDSTPDTRSTHG